MNCDHSQKLPLIIPLAYQCGHTEIKSEIQTSHKQLHGLWTILQMSGPSQHSHMWGWETYRQWCKYLRKICLNVKNFNSHGAEGFLQLRAASQFAPCSHQHHCTSHLVSPQPASWWLWGQSSGVEGCGSGTCCDPHCNMDIHPALICNTLSSVGNQVTVTAD